MQLNGYAIFSSRQLDATFAALADPTRRAILARLATGEASVTELAQPFAMSQPAVSKHLKVLERAGLVSIGRDAQRRPRRIEAAPLAEAAAWLEKYRAIWEPNFRRLDALLGELMAAESTPSAEPPAHASATASTQARPKALAGSGAGGEATDAKKKPKKEKKRKKREAEGDAAAKLRKKLKKEAKASRKDAKKSKKAER